MSLNNQRSNHPVSVSKAWREFGWPQCMLGWKPTGWVQLEWKKTTDT